MAEYFIQEDLDNTIHEITYEQIKEIYFDNKREERECKKVTESTYRGESYYKGGNFNEEFEKEILHRDPMTDGLRMEYPHGIILEQSRRRNYYRGEKQIYNESVPSLLRKFESLYKTEEEQELYRMVADMRIAEFSFLLNRFEHVKNWKFCDVLYETLAQHYGLETGWLDITSDFNVALFFATCFYDEIENKWKPLTKRQTELDESRKYGMIYHMPSDRMVLRWNVESKKFSNSTNKIIEYDVNGKPLKYKLLEHPVFTGLPENLIYPLGFQPFMRCHMQDGYGIYMRTALPLQQDFMFEKLKFRHNEKLSRDVYEMMNGGELIYPHEGLKQVDFIIKQIAESTVFSEEAFQYALRRNHKYRVIDEQKCRLDLENFIVNGRNIVIQKTHPWKLSSKRRKNIDRLYENFSIETEYKIKIMDRLIYPSGADMFEPWMLLEKETSPGAIDFNARQMEGCFNLWSRQSQELLSIIKKAKLTDF